MIPDNREDGLPVVSIAANVFLDGNISSVTLSQNLINIGNYAFSNNALTSIVLPNKLKTIGQRAFNTNQINDLVIPNSVTTINSDAFANGQLKTLVVGDGVTSLLTRAFYNNKLTSVKFLGAKPSLGSSVFAENLAIPDSGVLVPSVHLSVYKTAITSFGLTSAKFVGY